VLKGATITLIQALVNNPQTKSLTFGLQISEISGKAKKGKKKK
jgi:hypothetical protein